MGGGDRHIITPGVQFSVRHLMTVFRFVLTVPLTGSPSSKLSGSSFVEVCVLHCPTVLPDIVLPRNVTIDFSVQDMMKLF